MGQGNGTQHRSPKCKFSNTSFVVWGRSFKGGDTEQSCPEHWRPAKHAAGCRPLHGFSYSLLQLAEVCIVIPIL